MKIKKKGCKKYCGRRQTKKKIIHERIIGRIKKKSIQQRVEEKNYEMKVAEVVVVAQFIKDDVESSINDADVFDDDIDDEHEQIIGFR